jgi:hypothetical protein
LYNHVYNPLLTSYFQETLNERLLEAKYRIQTLNSRVIRNESSNRVLSGNEEAHDKVFRSHSGIDNEKKGGKAFERNYGNGKIRSIDNDEKKGGKAFERNYGNGKIRSIDNDEKKGGKVFERNYGNGEIRSHISGFDNEEKSGKVLGDGEVTSNTVGRHSSVSDKTLADPEVLDNKLTDRNLESKSYKTEPCGYMKLVQLLM